VIAHLAGKLIHKQPNSIIIDIGGVGYEVNIPLSTFYQLADVGADVALRVHTHVREDAIQLFGFSTTREKELFLRLTSVSGIGPRLAITMLSGMAAAELVTAIRTNDLGRLTTIPGVGRKTAERVVVELRDRMAAISPEETEQGAAAAAAGRGAAESVRDDTIAALMALGYPRPTAERAVDSSLRDEGDTTIQAVLKRSLKRLSR
jgi:Holliday junction DNA helicase RuvA